MQIYILMKRFNLKKLTILAELKNIIIIIIVINVYKTSPITSFYFSLLLALNFRRVSW